MTHMQTRVASRQWAAEVLSDALVTPAAGDPSGRYVGAEWFRAVFVRYSIGVDEWGDIIPGKGLCELRFDTFTVDRVTPKGVWLKGYHRLDGSVRRFQLRESKRQFAAPNQQDALISFMARKTRQIRILKSRIEDAEHGTDLAKAFLARLRGHSEQPIGLFGLEFTTMRDK